MTTILTIRKGVNGYRYAVCDADGQWLCNANTLAEIRNNWQWEIRAGTITLVRELDKALDMSRRTQSRTLLQAYMELLAK